MEMTARSKGRLSANILKVVRSLLSSRPKVVFALTFFASQTIP